MRVADRFLDPFLAGFVSGRTPSGRCRLTAKRIREAGQANHHVNRESAMRERGPVAWQHPSHFLSFFENQDPFRATVSGSLTCDRSKPLARPSGRGNTTAGLHELRWLGCDSAFRRLSGATRRHCNMRREYYSILLRIIGM